MRDARVGLWKKRLAGCFFMAVSAVFAFASEGLGLSAQIRPLEGSRSYYTVTTGDVDGDGIEEIVAGSFDHSLVVMRADGQILWRHVFEGLPYSIALGDVNADGTKEIAAAVMDQKGSVVLLQYKKGLIWSYNAELPCLAVAIGDVDGDRSGEVVAGSFLGKLYVFDKTGKVRLTQGFGEKNLVCAVACGDIDGRKGDEIVVGTSLGGVRAIDGRGKSLWHLRAQGVDVSKRRGKRKGKKGKKRQSDPHNKLENVQTIQIADLDRDGRNEILIGARPYGTVLLLDGDGTTRWHRSLGEYMDVTASTIAVAGDFTADPGLEVFATVQGTGVSGYRGEGVSVLLDALGDRRYLALQQTQFFDLASLKRVGAKTEEILLSSGIRGAGVNLVSFLDGGQDQLSGYCDAGELKVRHELAMMERTAKKNGGVPNAKPFHFLFRVDYRDIFGKDAKYLKSYLEAFWAAPGDNAIVITGLKEDLRNILRGDWKKGRRLKSREIVEIARWLEEQKIPFYLNAGKHAMLFFRVETLGEVMAAAKNACRGFLIDEDNYTRPVHWKGLLVELDRLLSLMKPYGDKKLIMNEYRLFWHRGLLVDPYFDTLFKPDYRGLVVPVYKPNNIKAPELNMAMLAGLWQKGVIEEWGVGVYADTWKWGPVFVGAPGDIHLRLVLMATSLGSNYVVVAKNLTWNKGFVDFAPQFRPHFSTLFELVRKGIVAPVEKPSDLVVNNVPLWEAADPQEVAMRDEGTQVYWQKLFGMKGWHDTGFFLQALRGNYLSGQFYQGRDYGDMLFPVNPNGFVPLVPYVRGTKQGAQATHWLVQGEKLLLSSNGNLKRLDSSDSLRRAVVEQGKTLPFSATGLYCSAVRTSSGYLIYLINPGVFELRDVQSAVTVSQSVQGLHFVDPVSGESLSVRDGQIPVTVPAGLFRLIAAQDATRVEREKMQDNDTVRSGSTEG